MPRFVKWGHAGIESFNAFAGQMKENAAAEAQLGQEADANRRKNAELKLKQEEGVRADTMFRASVKSSEATFAGWNPDADTSLYSSSLKGEHQALNDMVEDHEAQTGPQRDALALALSSRMAAFNTNLATHNGSMAVGRALSMAEMVAAQTGEPIPEEILLAAQALMLGGSGQPGTEGAGSPVAGGMNYNQLSGALTKWALDSTKRAEAGAMYDKVTQGAFAALSALNEVTQGHTDDEGVYHPGVDADGVGREQIDTASGAWHEVLEAASPESDVSPKELARLAQKARGLSHVALNEDARGTWQGIMDKHHSDAAMLTQNNNLLIAAGGDGVTPGGPLAALRNALEGKNPIEINIAQNNLAGPVKQLRKDNPNLTVVEAARMANNQIAEADAAKEKAFEEGDIFGGYLAHITSFPNMRGKSFEGDLTLKALDEGGPLIQGFGKQSSDDDQHGTSRFAQYTQSAHIVLGDGIKQVFKPHDRAPRAFPEDAEGLSPEESSEIRRLRSIGKVGPYWGISRGVAGIEGIFRGLGKNPKDYVGLLFGDIAKTDPELARAIYMWGGNPPTQRPLSTSDDPYGWVAQTAERWLWEVTMGTPFGLGQSSEDRWDKSKLMPPKPGAATNPWETVPGRGGPLTGARTPGAPSGTQGSDPVPATPGALSPAAAPGVPPGVTSAGDAKPPSKSAPKPPNKAQVKIAENTINNMPNGHPAPNAAKRLDPRKPIAYVENADGTTSTQRTISFRVKGAGGGEVLVPTVLEDGTIMSDEEAKQRYRDTGECYGIFTAAKHATHYAKAMSKYQAHALAVSAASSDLEASGGMVPVMPDPSMGGTPPGTQPGMPDPGMGMGPPDQNTPPGMPPDPRLSQPSRGPTLPLEGLQPSSAIEGEPASTGTRPGNVQTTAAIQAEDRKRDLRMKRAREEGKSPTLVDLYASSGDGYVFKPNERPRSGESQSDFDKRDPLKGMGIPVVFKEYEKQFKILNAQHSPNKKVRTPGLPEFREFHKLIQSGEAIDSSADLVLYRTYYFNESASGLTGMWDRIFNDENYGGDGTLGKKFIQFLKGEPIKWR